MDELTKMLEAGWTIEGYSNTILAAGAMTYSILLRKENALKAVTSVVTKGAVDGQVIVQLAPHSAPVKKGWF